MPLNFYMLTNIARYHQIYIQFSQQGTTDGNAFGVGATRATSWVVSAVSSSPTTSIHFCVPRLVAQFQQHKVRVSSSQHSAGSAELRARVIEPVLASEFCSAMPILSLEAVSNSPPCSVRASISVSVKSTVATVSTRRLSSPSEK